MDHRSFSTAMLRQVKPSFGTTQKNRAKALLDTTQTHFYVTCVPKYADWTIQLTASWHWFPLGSNWKINVCFLLDGMDYFRIRQTNLAEVISGREKRVGPFSVDRYFAETNTIFQFHGCIFSRKCLLWQKSEKWHKFKSVSYMWKKNNGIT